MGAVVRQQARLPQLAKHSGLLPFLKPLMHTAARADLPRQGLPLNPGSQDVEDAIQHLAVVVARAAAFGLGTFDGQKWPNTFPQRIRHTK